MDEKNELLKTGTCMKEAIAPPKLDNKLVQHQIDVEGEEIKFKYDNREGSNQSRSYGR